jgi:hypothetical protein
MDLEWYLLPGTSDILHIVHHRTDLEVEEETVIWNLFYSWQLGFYLQQ